MLPAFLGPNRSRQINLGGSTTTYSQEAVLDTVKARREQRLEGRRRQDSAHKIQAWWRGTSEARRVKDALKAQFDATSGPLVDWTRLLVVGWAGGEADTERLGRWSRILLEMGPQVLTEPFSTAQRESWLVLSRQIASLLLQAVAASPSSPHAIYHLQMLNSFLSRDNQASGAVAAYMLKRGFYSQISIVLTSIPLDQARTNTLLPLLASLSISPFSVLPTDSQQYSYAYYGFLESIFTLSLLPNRFPIPSLTQISANFPFDALHLISPAPLLEAIPSFESRAHFLANFATFIPPRLPILPLPALSAYLDILGSFFASLPPDILEPPSKTQPVTSWVHHEDSDDSDVEIAPRTGAIGPSTQAQPPLRLTLDTRTMARLITFLNPSHVNHLLNVTSINRSVRMRLFVFLLAVTSNWPARRDKILSNIVFSPGGPVLMKEIWREWLRSSLLGRVDRVGVEVLKDPSQQETWMALLFFSDMYSHALLTMGDDEFFSRGAGPKAARNPLTLDELVSFSSQLLHTVFPMYWNEDLLNVKEDRIPGTLIRWEAARDRLTRCLKAIHARDSRRNFTPPDHWLMTSQIDIQSFCEAAIYEGQNLDRNSNRPLSKRQMAYLSPRLGILNNIPFAIPFSVRVEIFRDFVANDMARLDQIDQHGYACTIRRTQVAKDGYDALNDLGEKLKRRIRITFIDQFGSEERGIDGGGVFKEFLTSLSKEAFDTDRGLWLATKEQALYPNPHSYAKELHQLSWYRFIGRVLGKALYEGILVDVNFATFFLAKWLGKQSYLDDLASLDPELYQGLVFLKNYEGNVDDLSLNFSVNDNDLGVTRTINLIPNGSNVPVTKENRTQYIYLVSNYRLNTQIKPQSDAFFEGLSEIIDPKWLRMFNQQELQVLIGGTEEPVNIDDLRANTVYGGAYDDQHPTIQAFWRVLKSLDQSQRCLFLRFVSSCARAPLLGFKELNPKFSVRDSGSDQARLPTASTCVNLLKLPMYTSERVLKAKLIQAINSGAGFDLS